MHKKIVERKQEEEEREQFIPALDIGHHFCVEGMEDEQQRGNERGHRMIGKDGPPQ